MFKSKFIVVILIMLIICLVLTFTSVFNNTETNPNIDENYKDEAVTLIQDENGNMHLTNVSHLHGEDSASAT